MLTRTNISLFFARETRRKFLFALLGSGIAALADAAGVLAILPLMQLITGESRESGVLGFASTIFGHPSDAVLAFYLAGVTFGAFLLKGVFTIVFRWWILGFVARQEATTSVRLLRFYLTAPYGLHIRRGSPEMLRTMNDAVGQVYSQVVVGVINIAAESLTILAIAGVLVILMPVPAALLLTYFALAGFLFYRFARPTASRAGDRMVQSLLRNYQSAMHAIGGIREIKIRHSGEYFLGRYRSSQEEYAGAKQVAHFLGEAPKYVFELVFIVGIGLMTVYVFSTGSSSQAVGALAMFAAAGFRIMPGAVRTVGSLNTLRLGRPAFDLVRADLADAAAQGEMPVAAPTAATLAIASDVRIDDISFRYPQREGLVLTDVSFTLPAGSAVALVGASGAGKTTLIDVILGLQAPVAGRILVDGQDIREVLPAWQQSLGLVPQDVYLLDASLRENIAFGEYEEDVDEDRLTESIQRAQLNQLVQELPEGLDTFLGERGMRLSGGQRQRIGIARALYTSPSLLILDEATSALDNETEKRISETIASLHGEITLLIVAHRLSTVRDCDAIIFMKDGRVEDIGDFETLRSENGEFARLVELGNLS